MTTAGPHRPLRREGPLVRAEAGRRSVFYVVRADDDEMGLLPCVAQADPYQVALPQRPLRIPTPGQAPRRRDRVGPRQGTLSRWS
jgi:hypothetical protein